MKQCFSMVFLCVAHMTVVSQANTKLSNLVSPTAINQHLLPNITNARDLGGTSYAWRNQYLRGYVYLDGTRFVSNAPGTGAYNAFVGSYAGYAVTTGKNNSALGHYALNKTTSGYSNLALGAYALYNNTEGYSNIAIGTRALYTNITGLQNVAIGDSALYYNEAGYDINDYATQNTAIGVKALYMNTTGAYNTAVGFESLYNNTTASTNTAVGYRALYNNTNTNGTNVGIGINAGYYSSSSSVFIGYNAYSAPDAFNAIGIGTNAYVNASNKVRIGNNYITSIGGQVGWSVFSDGRYKQNIREDVHGLDFINSLRPITYTVDVKGLNAYYSKGQRRLQGFSGDENLIAEQAKAEAAASKIVYNGFIAQDVEKAAQKLNYAFSGVDKPQNSDGLYGLRYSDFVVPLVKAVQELDSQNKQLKETITTLQAKNQRLEARLNRLEAMVIGSGNNTSTSASLEQNTPNPASSTTSIRYHIPGPITSARLDLTNAKGQLVKTVILSAGSNRVDLNTSMLASGTYNYTLYVEGKPLDSKRLVIAR